MPTAQETADLPWAAERPTQLTGTVVVAVASAGSVIRT